MIKIICPNCGSDTALYLDDPNDDTMRRCVSAVNNRWKGQYAQCYAEEESTLANGEQKY